MERRGFKSSVQSTVDKLHRCLESILVYTVTFVCLGGSSTKATVEAATEAEKDEDSADNDDALTDHLTRKKLINWCRTTSRMKALRMDSRGKSSLLRAVSKTMWAVDEPETETLLQQLMDMNLSSARESARYKERWENESGIRNHSAKVFSWEDVCRAFKDSDGIWKERTGDVDSIHVFTLANTIKRPILVIESNEDDDSTSAGLLSGLYLPTLISPELCFKSPIVLAFHEGRFSPVVVAKQEDGHHHLQTPTIKGIPLVTHRLEQFLIRSLASEESQKQGFALVGSYLKAEEVPCTGPSGLNHVLTARLVCLKPDVFDDAIGDRRSSHVKSRQTFSETCHARVLEEPKTTSEVRRYTAFLPEFSGLRCSDPLCNEPIDTEYYPKCRAHGLSASGGKTDDCLASAYPKPTTPDEKTKESGSSYRPSAPGKCSVPGCNRTGLEEYDGGCRYCYVVGNVATSPSESAENRHESGILKSSAELAREGLEKGRVENGGEGGSRSLALGGGGTRRDDLLEEEWKFDRQLKCSVPICGNVVQSSAFNGLCDECFATICKAKATDSNQTKGMPRNVANISTVPAWSTPSTRCVLTRAKCLSDGCHLPVDDQDLGLCKTCSDQQRQILEAFELQKHRSESRKSPSSGSRPSDKLSVQGGHLPGHPLGRTESSQRHWTASSWRPEGAARAKMCLSSSCDRFGDPGYAGYCSVCYVKRN